MIVRKRHADPAPEPPQPTPRPTPFIGTPNQTERDYREFRESLKIQVPEFLGNIERHDER